MADQSTETQNLTDGTGTITLFRNVKLNYGPKEFVTGDRMVVEYRTGETEDVFVTREGGALKVKRMAMQMEIRSATPAVEASGSTRHALLDDLNEADQKRLLTAYSLFSSGE